MLMQTPPALIESSFADAILRIESASELAEGTRRQWVCSLRQIGKALDRSLELVPARWTALRIPVSRLHHHPLGVTPKTLANHKANLKAALRYFTEETGGPVRGAPLSPSWAILRDCIDDRGRRARLYGFMRFCSAKGIEPHAVTDTVVESYLTYREATSALAAGIGAHRLIARTWNKCADALPAWPTVRLTEPALPSREAGPPWEAFPIRLRKEIDAYLSRLNATRRTAAGRRRQGSKPSTVATRRRELVAFARKAVHIGVAIDELDSFAALLRPDRVERVLDAYWGPEEHAPKTYAIDLSWKLHSIARETGYLKKKQIQQLDDLRAALDKYRSRGLTDLNLTVVRQVLSGSVWPDVINLPYRLMGEARTLRDQSPIKAALKAQKAVAIALLTVAPVRCGNLARIKLEENLIRPAGPERPFWLIFSEYDVKNRIKLEFPLDEHVTALIEEYLYDHRPALLRGSNELWLIPGLDGTAKNAPVLSKQITDAVHKSTGLRIRAHQFRHAAAALILRETNDYEFVRRVLGHKNIQTTINFYIGLETTDANRRFGNIVRQHLFRESRP
jgi:integrase